MRKSKWAFRFYAYRIILSGWKTFEQIFSCLVPGGLLHHQHHDCTYSIVLLLELQQKVITSTSLCICMLAWMCLVCVTGFYLIIIEHQDAGAWADFWFDEVRQEKTWAVEKIRICAVGQCARWLYLSVSWPFPLSDKHVHNCSEKFFQEKSNNSKFFSGNCKFHSKRLHVRYFQCHQWHQSSRSCKVNDPTLRDKGTNREIRPGCATSQCLTTGWSHWTTRTLRSECLARW